MTARQICREDILPMTDYAKLRDDRRRAMAALKRNRRIGVGPDVTFYFENFGTMLHQVHEMLFIEKGGEAQIEDELRAYNPLIPNGSELVATMMIEIEEPDRRARVLAGLGGIQTCVAFEIAGERIAAVPEGEEDRTTAAGKTSSVHFLKFPFSPGQVAAFCTPSTRILLAVSHPNYDHLAALPEAVRQALAEDFA